MTCNISCTFRIPCKLCDICLFRYFPQAQFCLMSICHFFQLFCHIILIVLQNILKGIWKSTGLSRHFSMIFFSSIQKHPLVLKKKCRLNFWSTHPLAFQKIVFMKILGNVPLKHPFYSPLFEYIYRSSRCVKEHPS